MKLVEQKGKYITTTEVDSLLFKEFRRPLLEIMNDLRKPIQPRFLKYKMMGGKKLTFVSWYQLNKLVNNYDQPFGVWVAA